MKVKHVRTGRELRLANPTQFMAQERTIVEEAYAGDVMGIYDPGYFEIGDTITDGAEFTFEGIPSFAPEHFARLVLVDPLRRKQLTKGIEQLAQEGTIQLYRPPAGRAGDLVLGAVGQLQLEVVKYRLENEYDCKVRLESMSYSHARWVSRKDGAPVEISDLNRAHNTVSVVDVRDRPVLLFMGEWQIRSAERDLDEYIFAETAVGVVVRNE
jgi:peptide chain release factor 3